jgi:hypothetical protein
VIKNVREGVQYILIIMGKGVIKFQNFQKNLNFQKSSKFQKNTVKPVYSHHLGEFDKMTTIDR